MYVVRTLVRYGADLHGLDGWNRTPLHLAARRGNLWFARFLLKKGAIGDLTWRDAQGRTPYDLAAANTHRPSAQKLLHVLSGGGKKKKKAGRIGEGGGEIGRAHV